MLAPCSPMLSICSLYMLPHTAPQKVRFMSGMDKLFAVDKYAQALAEICRRRDIHVELGKELVEVRPETREGGVGVVGCVVCCAVLCCDSSDACSLTRLHPLLPYPPSFHLLAAVFETVLPPAGTTTPAGAATTTTAAAHELPPRHRETVKFDFLHVTPPMGPPEFLQGR